MSGVIKQYRGDSTPVAKVVAITPLGPVATGQVFTVWCNGKPVSYAAKSGDGVDDVVNGLAAALQATTIPEFAEFLATSAGNVLLLSAATAGIPFAVTVSSSANMTVAETTRGVGPTNEVHEIQLLGTYAGGTFTLTYNFGGGNVTTAAIAYNATAAAVQTALAALAGVGAGNVAVAGGPGPSSPWFVTWTGTFAGTAVAVGTLNGGSLTGSGSVNISTQQPGAGPTDCLQALQFVAVSSGQFTLTFLGQTTGNINLGASAATIQSALQGLSSIGSGNVLVYGEGAGGTVNANLYVIHFTGALAATSLPVITLGGGIAGSGSTAIIQQGAATSQAAWQFIDLTSGPVFPSTTFTLTFNGHTTSAISTVPGGPGYVSAAIQSALQAIGCPVVSVGGSDGLTGVAATLFLVKITSYAPQAAPVLTATISGFSPTITVLSNGLASQDDIQQVWVAASGGTFTLSDGGQTTNNIAYNASTGTLQTRIQTDLSTTFTAVTVTGSGTLASPWVITVTNPANAAVTQMTGNAGGLSGGGSVTEVTHGQAGTNEVQTITLALGVNGGTFMVSFSGATTPALAWNVTAAQLQAALVALSTINTVTVTGSAGGPWTITWSGAQGSAPQALLFADGSLLTGAVAQLVTLVTDVWSAGPLHYDDPNNWSPPGVPNALDLVYFAQTASSCLHGLDQIATFQVDSSIQTVAVSATGGTFTLTESAQTTAAIAYNASAAAVAAAILAAFTNTVVAVTVTGAGTAANPWVITMLGPNGVSQPMMTANAGSLTGGAGTVTITASTLIWTSKSALQTGQSVYVTTTTTLPAALAGNVAYYLVNVNRDAQTFQLATTLGGAAIGLSTLGSGTHTIGARLGYLEISSIYTGQIGLPYTNPGGAAGTYVEYRERYLHVGLATIANGGTQNVVIGTGNGSGSPKIQLNTDVDQIAGKQIASGGSSDPGVNAIVWLGKNANSTWNVINGDFGSCLFPGETSSLSLLTERAGSVSLGSGMTVGQIDKTGGSIVIDGATVNGVVVSR